MPAAAPTARATADRIETWRSFGQIPDVLEVLRGGGDERIALDPLTRRDVYGCRDRPETDAGLFGSSTASSVSERGLAAAQVGWLQLAAAQSSPSNLLADWFDAIRGRILKYCGAPSADCILAASGADAELIALALAADGLRRPLTNIVLAPSETGRGVATAAEGRHFQNSAPFAAGVGAGTRLAGWERADIRVETVEIRDLAGAPRASSAVEGDVRTRVRAAIASGRGALVHLVDVSKTGRKGLGLEAARRIAAEAPDHTLVIADRCQLRCSSERLRAARCRIPCGADRLHIRGRRAVFRSVGRARAVARTSRGVVFARRPWRPRRFARLATDLAKRARRDRSQKSELRSWFALARRARRASASPRLIPLWREK
jgi:hypothetical protein